MYLPQVKNLLSPKFHNTFASKSGLIERIKIIRKMPDIIIESEVYKNIDYVDTPLPVAEYDNCTFINCNFAEGDLSKISFLECKFEHCNLSNATLKQTAFKEVEFVHCKMIGADFSNCNDFLLEMNFNSCQLNLTSFYLLSLKGTRFVHCSLREADFTEANFNESVFEHCDLQSAVFDRTKLEHADLSTSHNYAIDPDNNQVQKARFSLEGLPGLLHKHRIIVTDA